MIPLPEKYSKNGYDYVVFDRDDDTAIAEQWEVEIGEPHIVAYEVFEIEKRSEWTAFGKTYPAKEGVPSSEQWGNLGFTCSNLENAQKRREFLRKQILERKKRNTNDLK